MKAERRGEQIWFWCAACNTHHAVNSGWSWNGDTEKPTFHPSIRVSGYEMSPEGLAMFDRGERPPAGQLYPGRDTICHSFVTDGQIHYLSDCTHKMAGQTVPLEDLP